jgi:hypothetical protein
MKRILFAAAASLVLTMAISTTPSFAKKVSNHDAATAISNCLLDGGVTSEPQGNGSYAKCCTKAGGYCIICKQDGTGLCNKTAYILGRGAVSKPQALETGAMAPARSRGGPINPTRNFGN